MLKLLYRIAGGNMEYTLIAFVAVTVLTAVFMTAMFLHIYRDKKVRLRARVLFIILPLLFVMGNVMSIQQLVSVEQVTLADVGWLVSYTMLCKVNTVCTVAALTVLILLCAIKNIKQAYTKARKEARRRREEEYY